MLVFMWQDDVVSVAPFIDPYGCVENWPRLGGKHQISPKLSWLEEMYIIG